MIGDSGKVSRKLNGVKTWDVEVPAVDKPCPLASQVHVAKQVVVSLYKYCLLILYMHVSSVIFWIIPAYFIFGTRHTVISHGLDLDFICILVHVIIVML